MTMKLKTIAQVVAIGCSILALSACTHSRANKTFTPACDPMMAGGTSDVQATGIGESENFGDEGSNGGRGGRGLHKRIYYFDYDSNIVREEDKPAILSNANYLVAHSGARIILEGHTDPRGSREYNVALGERRAKAVADILESNGVNPRQIRIVSYGAERLAAPGHNEKAYQMDRRAVIAYNQN